MINILETTSEKIVHGILEKASSIATNFMMLDRELKKFRNMILSHDRHHILFDAIKNRCVRFMC